MSTAAPKTDTPAATKQFPFIIRPTFKKLRWIDPQGQELHADDSLWSRMQFTDPFVQNPEEQQQDGSAAGTDGDKQQQDDVAPDPQAALQLFQTAKHELEWLQLMLRELRSGKYLTVGRVERPPVPQRVAGLALEVNSRYKRRTLAAAAASEALSEGAAALAALGSREDAFYQQVAQLQQYWKVQQAPPDSPYAYIVNLKLSSSSSSSDGSSSSADLTEACARIGRGPVSVVPILKDPAGTLRVQIPAIRQQTPPTVMNKAQEDPPTVYTGPAAIHALLVQQLRLNAWHLVLHSLDSEITQRLGLPARLQPSVAAAAAAAAAGSKVGSSSADQAAAAAATAAARSEGTGGDEQNGSGAAAATAGQRSQISSSSSSMRQIAAAGVGSHFTFYATLSNLVLQAVVGSAGTAGEDLILEQQQQQQQQQGAAAVAEADSRPEFQQQQQQQQAHTPGDSGYLSVGSLNLELDVGGPWERAAAAAGSNGSLLYQPPAAHVGSSSSSTNIISNPQLLSLRPLALSHLLITQLGHLINKSYYQDKRPIENAAIAFAAAAREQQRRYRDRAAAAASSSTALLLPAVSFMTCLSRWLAHSSSRELVRSKVDEILMQYPGILAQTLPCCHSCNSAMQLLPCQRLLPAGAGVRSYLNKMQGNSQVASIGQQRQLDDGDLQEASTAAAAPVLLLMSDAGILLESAAFGQASGTAAAASAAAASGLGQHRRCRDVQQSVNHLVALPDVLKPLLNVMWRQS